MIVILCHIVSQGRGRAVVLEPFYTWYTLSALSCLYLRLLCPSPSNIILNAIAHMLKGESKYKSDHLKVALVFYFKQNLLCGCCIFAGVSELLILPPV